MDIRGIKIDTRTYDFDAKITEVEADLTTSKAELNTKIDDVEENLTTKIEKVVDDLSTTNIDLTTKITKVETNLTTSKAELNTELNSKVDKVSGKGLSTNDYTTAEKNKLAGLNNYDDTDVRGLVKDETARATAAENSLSTSINNVKSSTVTSVNYDSTNKKITKTINGTVSDVIALATMKTAMALNNVTNVATESAITKDSTKNITSGAVYTLKQTVDSNKSAIDTLNGTGTGSVKKTVTDEIAKVVSNAPEDFDTLKEISNWISTHENSASAMNTQINTNKSDIATLKTSVAGKAAASHTHDDRYFTETEVTNKLAEKSDIGHTHTKSEITDFPTSLPANGGTATKATQDGNGNVITSTYVKKSGDTLTGPIVMKENQYTLDTAQLDMKNSDIKGANAIWFDDHAEVGEGLKFPRSSGSNYDFMRLDDGKIKVASNVAGNANTATESIVAYTSDIPTSLPANGGTANSAKNIVPNYTTKELTTVSNTTIKYIKIATCTYANEGTLKVSFQGNSFEDRLIINFGGGNALYPMLCGHYYGNNRNVKSVIAQKGSSWNSNYSIYIKVHQLTNLIVSVALLTGSCTIDISESKTAPTNISEWNVGYGLFGDLTGGLITPRQGSYDGNTVSIGNGVGNITIGDTDNSNSGYTIINNDCKMLNGLEVSGDCKLNGSCTIKNTSDNKYKGVVSGEITGTTLTLYLN